MTTKHSVTSNLARGSRRDSTVSRAASASSARRSCSVVASRLKGRPACRAPRQAAVGSQCRVLRRRRPRPTSITSGQRHDPAHQAGQRGAGVHVGPGRRLRRGRRAAVGQGVTRQPGQMLLQPAQRCVQARRLSRRLHQAGGPEHRPFQAVRLRRCKPRQHAAGEGCSQGQRGQQGAPPGRGPGRAEQQLGPRPAQEQHQRGGGQSLDQPDRQMDGQHQAEENGGRQAGDARGHGLQHHRQRAELQAGHGRGQGRDGGAPWRR